MFSFRVWPIYVARRAETEQPRASVLGMRPQENRPERAAERRVLFPKATLVESDSIRTPFQGEFIVRVVPRAEALGYSLFALRAMRRAQENFRAASVNISSIRHLLEGTNHQKSKLISAINN
jgi:hypothetical protein